MSAEIRTMPAPRKLRVDSILEALVEIRFVTAEHPEAVLGKLVSTESWRSFVRTTLPAGNVPPALREADPNLQILPTVELKAVDGSHAIHIGDRSIALHAYKPYPGWKVFYGQVSSLSENLFGAGLRDINVDRIGLRYINGFTKEDHGVQSLLDLNFNFNVNGNQIAEPMILQYQRSTGDHALLVKLSYPQFVSPAIPGLSAFVDIDVATPVGFATRAHGVVVEWLKRAHDLEKDEFFALFTDELRRRLVEEA
jgi:uncharacterized protein (TIGR04255 family)